MNKICGYSCEHNKSGVCQISVCDKKSNISDKTEIQTFTKYIDPVITELQQENKKLNGAIQTYDILLKLNVESNKQLKLIDKEHQQINGELRQANKLLNEQYIRLYKDYIQLKAQIEEYQKALDETMSEKIDIENNWNKLREWIVYNKHNENTEQHYLVVDYGTLLGKMQELEQGSDSNE